MFPSWTSATGSNFNPQAAPTPQLQAAPTPQLQGSPLTVQGSSPNIQPTINPNTLVDPTANAPIPTPALSPTAVSTPAVTVDPNIARSAALRDQITQLVNSVKDIFNSRYGQVDKSAVEQEGKLNTRFGNESTDLAHQITNENDKIGASYAGRGGYDSSYRGNAEDAVTHAGQSQTRDLGTELSDNIAKIAAWVAQQKTGYDASKASADTTLTRANDPNTTVNGLDSLRNNLDTQIATLQSKGADNNTAAENSSALEAIAPSSPRGVQLKTTLSQILAGNANVTQKAAIGHQLITSANLSPEDQQKLAQAFQAGLSTTTTDTNKVPTA